MENLDKLVLELCKLPNETQYVEFKHNNYSPDMIGKDISALANSAALMERKYAYMLWGIDDISHKIVGTDKNLQNLKQGNQELENWLRDMLSKNADFEFYSTNIEGKNVGIIVISPAMAQTVTFKKKSYIRIGSYTKELENYPSTQAKLWDRIRNIKFEEQLAMKDLTLNEAINLLNTSIYFEILKLPVPDTDEKIFHYMKEEGIILKQDNGLFSITNLGAIAFAKRLNPFPHINRKAIRLVQYNDDNRVNLVREYNINKGYVVGLEEVVQYIDVLLPSEEIIQGLLRTKKQPYPPIAIREIIANAIIHQDFSITGTGPVIEIFKTRLEVTNPGIPLIDISRIIDNPPKSRNEKLASLMRHLKMCEELGTGWDKIVISCEVAQLPAPIIELYSENIRVTLFTERPFSSISPENKLHACYLHACIKQVQGEQMTNVSLRKRFGLEDSSSGAISRLIKLAVKKKYIKPLDADTAPRYMKYVPWWA